MYSNMFSLNKNDVVKIIHNTFIVFGPVLLVMMTQIQAGQIDMNIIYALIFTTIIDIMKRFMRGEPIIQENTLFNNQSSNVSIQEDATN